MTTQTDALDQEVPEQQEVEQEDTTVPESSMAYQNDPREALEAQYEAQQEQQEEQAEPTEATNEQQTPQGAAESKERQPDVDDQLTMAGVIDPNATFKMKLDGVEEEVTGQEIIAGFQKNTVASRRLQEATQAKKEADQLLAAAKAQQQPQDDSTVNDDESGQQDADVKSVAASIVESIVNGDDDAATEALTKVLAGQGRGNSTQGSQPVNAEEIASQVKQQLNYDSALTQFSESYADIVADDELAAMTNRYLAQEVESGLHDSPQEALFAAGDRTRDWMKKMGMSAETKETTTQNSRVANKRALEPVPSVSTASAAEVAEAEQSSMDVILEMQQQRGYGT